MNREDIQSLINVNLFLNCKDYNRLSGNEKNYDEIVNKLKVIDEVIFGYTSKSWETHMKIWAVKLLDLMIVFRYIKYDRSKYFWNIDEVKTNAESIKISRGYKNPIEVVVYGI